MFVIGAAPPASSSRVLGSLCLTCERQGFLPIGRAALERITGPRTAESSSGKKAANYFPDEHIQIPAGITPQNLKKYTLYDMLGFTPEWADSADTEAIKRAYHKAVLMYHPDKAQYKTADGKEDRSVFLKIQEAFNVLSNEAKRRAYDSQLPFDDTIPTEERVLKALEKGPHKFFKLFDPVFKRNARFAVHKPVPELGDMSTPIQQVYRFYDYWIKFESWRDFTGVGAEHKPDDAGSREEKRWMQKENERIAKKLKKKEMDRLIELVMLAEKRDPRIAADKESKKAAKEADKNAREADSRRKAEDEAQARAWSDQLEAEFQAKKGLSKADREKAKKAQSNARNILRKLFRASAAQGLGEGEYGIISAADVEILCGGCDLEDLNIINAAMGGTPASKDISLFVAGGFDEVVPRLEFLKERQTQAAEDERILREAKRREQEEARSPKKGKEPAPREWTRDMLNVLSKSVMRYPPGYQNRWAVAAAYLNDQIKPSDAFTADEVLVAAHKAALSVAAAAATETA